MQRTEPAEQDLLGGASAHCVWTSSDVASASSGSEASSASAPEPRVAVTNAAVHWVWNAIGGATDNPFDMESTESEANDEVRGEHNAVAMEEALKLHETGKCNPCYWARRKRGCRFGDDCNFCHLPHGSFLETRARPRRSKRVRYRRIIDALQEMYPSDPGRMREVAQELSCDPYLHDLVRLRAAQAVAGAADKARGDGDGASSDPAGCSTDGTAAADSVAMQRVSGNDARWQRSQPAHMLTDSTGVGAGGAAVR